MSQRYMFTDSRNVERQTLQAHYKLILYFVFSIHSGGDG